MNKLGDYTVRIGIAIICMQYIIYYTIQFYHEWVLYKKDVFKIAVQFELTQNI